MSHVQPLRGRRRGRTAFHALFLAAGTALLLCPVPLAAQQANTNPQDLTGAATPAYRPVSPGAVPEATDPNTSGDAGTIFVDDGTDASAAPLVPAVAADPSRSGADDQATAATPPRSRAAQAATDADAASGLTNRRARSIDVDDRQPLDPRAERTGAIEGTEVRSDDDPFAPVGIPFGTFVLRPSIEQGLTATTNAGNGPGGRSAVLSETTLRLNATSDWASNSATIDASGNFRESVSGESLHEARGRIDGTLTLDLDHEWQAIAKAGYEIAPESASSPVSIGDVASQPTRQSFDGSLAIAKDIGKLRFGLTGAAQRDTYGDADLLGGGVLSQKDRNETLYTTTLRGGYEISPALTPFAELEVGRRLYDERLDDNGYARSADRLGIRAGTELDLGEKLNGELSAGWINEDPDDGRLASISGASVNADFKWSPERGTVIGLTGNTTVEGTTTPGESGSLLYSGQLTAERRIRSDLTANAALGAAWRDYSGTGDHDLILSGEAGLTWWLNRYVGLSTKARYEKQTSSLPGRDYDAASIFAGIKVQR